MSSSELAQKYNVQIRTIYNWVKSGCPHDYVNKGRKMVLEFDSRAVARWLKEVRK